MRVDCARCIYGYRAPCYKEPNKTYQPDILSSSEWYWFKQVQKCVIKFKIFCTNFIRSQWWTIVHHLKRSTLFFMFVISIISIISRIIWNSRLQSQNHQPCQMILTNVLPAWWHLSQLRRAYLWQSHRESHRHKAIRYSGNVIRSRNSPMSSWFRANLIGHVITRHPGWHRRHEPAARERTRLKEREKRFDGSQIDRVDERTFYFCQIRVLPAISFLIDAIIGPTILFTSLRLLLPRIDLLALRVNVEYQRIPMSDVRRAK